MIKVKIYSKSDQIIGFEIMGHANYEEYGKDIICASVSMLAINTVNSIEMFTNDLIHCIKKEDGYLYCIVQSGVSKDTQLLLNAFELGITSVKKQYGSKYIKIDHEEV